KLVTGVQTCALPIYSRRNPPPSPGIGSLGADLTYDPAARAYRFAHIFRGDGFDAGARSPLLAPGLNVREGDLLLAINGVPLKAKIGRASGRERVGVT